jgi:hypothetical protein
MSRSWGSIGLAGILLAGGFVSSLTGAVTSAAAAAGGSALTPVEPARLLDTRAATTIDGQFSNIGKLAATNELALTVAGRGGVPADAAAVAMNLTIVDPSAAGFLTAYPCGAAKPNTSNVNFVAGQTVANLSITKVGSGGKVCFVSDQPAHLIADVTAFSGNGAALTAITPARLLESRAAPTVDGQQANIGKRNANDVVEVAVSGRAGVPSDASSVALNITVVDPDGAGFVTAYPCGAAKPNASTLNFRAGQTVANLTLTKIGAGGKVCITSDRAAHLIADVTAFSPAGSSLGTLSPARLLDTRRSPTVDGRYSFTGRMNANVVTYLPVIGRAGIASTATTAVLNLTITDPASAGFLTAYPCGSPKPNTSNVNFTPGQTVANLSVIKIGAAGKICLVSDQPTQLIVDITSFDTGSESAVIPPGDATVGGCDVRPPNDPWNQDITSLGLNPQSATWVNSINGARARNLHADFGSDPTYGIPFTIVPENQPLIPVTFRDYADESDPGPYPVAPYTAVESGSDGHALIVKQGECKLYELGNTTGSGNTWSASGGAIFDLKTSSYRTPGWTSSDAAGLPILPGLARYEEVKSGVINHALRFTVPTTQRGYIFPASHFAGSNNPSLPPMGARFRLRADYDISGFTGDSLVILTALKKYGMIVADNGSAWYISGATDTRWNDDDLNQLKTVPGSVFDVVDTGPVTTG